MNVKTLGIDLAKRVFQLHGIDSEGRVIIRKRLSRTEFPNFIAKLPPCLIGMEACSGSNYWARKFIQFGHTVKLMSPQFVKPYVKSNKNDKNDAEAICEAVARPTMRFIPIKEVKQQDIQALHRIRSQLIQTRTALVNQIRGLLAEYGVIIPIQIQNVRKRLSEILDDQSNELTEFSRALFKELYEDLIKIDERMHSCDKKLVMIFKTNSNCKRISEVPGVGLVTATAIIASINDAKVFKNGRELSAWLGLVPRQFSSGNKQRLLGISKRGDCYLRTLLIHGARSVIRHSSCKEDARSQWLNSIKKRRGANKACVALANKNARVIWAILAHGTGYKAA